MIQPVQWRKHVNDQATMEVGSSMVGSSYQIKNTIGNSCNINIQLRVIKIIMIDKKEARKQAINRAKLSISKLSIISRNINMVNEKLTTSTSCSPQFDETKSVSCLTQEQSGLTNMADIDTFHLKYRLGRKIGEGSSGVVRECLHLKRNKIYACKTIMFDDEQVPLMKKSFKEVRQLDHSNIIRYKALYLDLQKHLAYLVMEYVGLPSLMQYISTINHPVDENEIKWIFQELFKTLRHMHSKGLSHRDIKPDNIMVNKDIKKIKIIDFGIAKKMIVRKQKVDMLTITGTLFYRAPEMFLGGGYNEKVDVWAAGVTLWEVLKGKTPFASEFHSETIQNIQSLDLEKQEEECQNVKTSFLLKNLIYRLLRKDPKERFSAAEALEHLWFEKKQFKIHQRYSDVGHIIETQYSKFKKTMVEYDPNSLKKCKNYCEIRKNESPTYHRMEVDDF